MINPVGGGHNDQGVNGVNGTDQNADLNPDLSGDAMFTGGIALMYLFMTMLGVMAADKFKHMQDKQKVAREANKVANEIEAALAKLAEGGDPKAKGDLPDDVRKWCHDHNVQVDGQSFDEWFNEHGGKFDQGDLKSLKAAVDAISSEATDWVANTQLQLQKLMQTYNVCVSLINQMQTLVAQMNKDIAQNIR